MSATIILDGFKRASRPKAIDLLPPRRLVGATTSLLSATIILDGFKRASRPKAIDLLPPRRLVGATTS
ncbi:hypothetical protein D9B51_11910, partial [Corynebacterium diphtheriae]